MKTRVLLIRHGETEWNAGRRIQGQLDVPLSERGRRQAEALAERLASEPLSAVYASDLSRAWQTAQAVAAAHRLPVQREAALREAYFGEWEGLDRVQILARYEEEHRLWVEDSSRHRPTGGETIASLVERAGGAYDRIAAARSGETVAIVAHGGSIRALILHAMGMPLDAFSRLPMRNASLSRIEIDDGEPMLALYDDVCFLTP